MTYSGEVIDIKSCMYFKLNQSDIQEAVLDYLKKTQLLVTSKPERFVYNFALNLDGELCLNLQAHLSLNDMKPEDIMKKIDNCVGYQEAKDEQR